MVAEPSYLIPGSRATVRNATIAQQGRAMASPRTAMAAATPPAPATPRRPAIPHWGFSQAQTTPQIRERSISEELRAGAPPFKAMRPPERTPMRTPGTGVMTLEEVSQAFHNLHAQMSDEKAHIDRIAGVVSEHATNLEQANEVVQGMRREREEDGQQ